MAPQNLYNTYLAKVFQFFFAALQAIGGKLVMLGQWGVGFMVVALLGMSTAQYVSF